MLPQISRYLAYAVGALVLLAGTFAAGRYSAPTKTIDRVEYVEKVREVRLTTVARSTQIKWRRVTVSTPDGTTTQTEDGQSYENENSTETAKVENDTEARKEKVTENVRAQWSISVTAGLLLPTQQNSYRLVTPTFGAHVQRRILGPVWVGAWFQTVGAGGVSVGLEL